MCLSVGMPYCLDYAIISCESHFCTNRGRNEKITASRRSMKLEIDYERGDLLREMVKPLSQ